jgi:predicted RNase H-like nuclease (RuvC/YqgF family)
MYRTGLIVSKEFETLNWDDIRVPIIRADPLLDLGEYVLVEESLVKEIDNMWRKIEEMEANERKERILRMIKEYQESRRDASKV